MCGCCYGCIKKENDSSPDNQNKQFVKCDDKQIYVVYLFIYEVCVVISTINNHALKIARHVLTNGISGIRWVRYLSSDEKERENRY